MQIAYSTDQFLPRTATDAEQIMATVAALGSAGATVDLLLPGYAQKHSPKAKDLAAFYEVPPTFEVIALRGRTPTFRGLEKVAHGMAVPYHDIAAAADVLYTRNLPTVLAALQFGRTPVVYETYRPWPDQRPRRSPIFRWIFKHPRFLGAVLHSRLAADSYRRIGARDEQLLVAHNGYDPKRLEPMLSQEDARTRLGLPTGPRVVTYAGHVSLEKGLGLVLDIAEALPDTRFVLVGSKGDGPIEQRAATMANVTIVPWQPFGATVPYLYAADVLLIPPTRGPLEAIGNTVLPMKTFLYMAAGRTIFGPTTPDLTEVLTDGYSARLVPPDTPEVTVSALRDLLADEMLQHRLAAAARAEVQTWNARAEHVLAFVESRLMAFAA